MLAPLTQCTAAAVASGYGTTCSAPGLMCFGCVRSQCCSGFSPGCGVCVCVCSSQFSGRGAFVLFGKYPQRLCWVVDAGAQLPSDRRRFCKFRQTCAEQALQSMPLVCLWPSDGRRSRAEHPARVAQRRWPGDTGAMPTKNR